MFTILHFDGAGKLKLGEQMQQYIVMLTSQKHVDISHSVLLASSISTSQRGINVLSTTDQKLYELKRDCTTKRKKIIN